MGKANLCASFIRKHVTEPAQRGCLTFIGLGLHDAKDISVRGFEEIQGADVVFAESYTSTLAEGALDELARRAGKSIVLLDRASVEQGERIVKAAADKKIVLLVAGDPMTATTHVDLRIRCARAGIRTSVIHNSSVLTAVPGVLGLQHYKFGRTTTVPFPRKGYSPTSPYEVIAENVGRGLHTLVLLDIDAERNRYMTVNEGLNLLLDMECRMCKKVILQTTLVCGVARAGSPDCVAKAGPVEMLMKEDFGPPLHTIVVPGKLHFMEEEALELLAGKPK